MRLRSNGLSPKDSLYFAQKFIFLHWFTPSWYGLENLTTARGLLLWSECRLLTDWSTILAPSPGPALLRRRTRSACVDTLDIYSAARWISRYLSSPPANVSFIHSMLTGSYVLCRTFLPSVIYPWVIWREEEMNENFNINKSSSGAGILLCPQ